VLPERARAELGDGGWPHNSCVGGVGWGGRGRVSGGLGAYTVEPRNNRGNGMLHSHCDLIPISLERCEPAKHENQDITHRWKAANSALRRAPGVSYRCASILSARACPTGQARCRLRLAGEQTMPLAIPIGRFMMKQGLETFRESCATPNSILEYPKFGRNRSHNIPVRCR
jgi:hypothetical protein